jgi:hypothetical protein
MMLWMVMDGFPAAIPSVGDKKKMETAKAANK